MKALLAIHNEKEKIEIDFEKNPSIELETILNEDGSKSLVKHKWCDFLFRTKFKLIEGIYDFEIKVNNTHLFFSFKSSEIIFLEKNDNINSYRIKIGNCSFNDEITNKIPANV